MLSSRKCSDIHIDTCFMPAILRHVQNKLLKDKVRFLVVWLFLCLFSCFLLFFCHFLFILLSCCLQESAQTHISASHLPFPFLLRYFIQSKMWVPHINYKETISTWIKDSQSKSALWCTGKVCHSQACSEQTPERRGMIFSCVAFSCLT